MSQHIHVKQIARGGDCPDPNVTAVASESRKYSHGKKTQNNQTTSSLGI